jgi:hypothetical protein
MGEGRFWFEPLHPFQLQAIGAGYANVKKQNACRRSFSPYLSQKRRFFCGFYVKRKASRALALTEMLQFQRGLPSK